jgi:hypothetical protein
MKTKCKDFINISNLNIKSFEITLNFFNDSEKIKSNYKNELNMRFIYRIKFMKNSYNQDLLLFQFLKFKI